MDAQALEGGFGDPAVCAAETFRAVLDAMARPGQVHTVSGAAPPRPLSPAAGAVALTLCDHDTPMWIGPGIATAEIRAWLAFHTGAPERSRDACAFAFGTWTEMTPLSDFALGTPEFPDRSTTLVVEVPELGASHRLTGPGIKTEARLTVPDPVAFQANHMLFPLGWDVILTCGDQIAALPRTTSVER